MPRNDRKPEMYVQVLHSDTNLGRQIANQLNNAFGRPGQHDYPVDVVGRDRLAALQARTLQAAEVFLVLSDAPSADEANEVLLLPVMASGPFPWNVRSFFTLLQAGDFLTVGSAYNHLRGEGIPCVLLNRVPLSAPSATPPPSDRQRAGDSSAAQRQAARGVTDDWERTRRQLGEIGPSHSADVRDAAVDPHRTRLADIWKCSDDVIPGDLVPLIDDIHDDEIRQFLRSALCIADHVPDFIEPSKFDYALPGSGLWRAFERALNLSVVAALRMKASIGPGFPTGASPSSGKSKPHIRTFTGYRQHDPPKDPRFVYLDRRDQHGALQGLTLGYIKDALEWAYANLPPAKDKDKAMTCIPVKDTLIDKLAHAPDGVMLRGYSLGTDSGDGPWESDLSKAISGVKFFRDPKSHMEPMSETEFNELRGLLINGGHLGKVLKLVRALNPAVS